MIGVPGMRAPFGLGPRSGVSGRGNFHRDEPAVAWRCNNYGVFRYYKACTCELRAGHTSGGVLVCEHLRMEESPHDPAKPVLRADGSGLARRAFASPREILEFVGVPWQEKHDRCA